MEAEQAAFFRRGINHLKLSTPVRVLACSEKAFLEVGNDGVLLRRRRWGLVPSRWAG